ncbi:MAG: LicD family protein, partial [Gemmatimonadetes bacterium]|nr:LicD family protein [Gemmatimonadota bacterium]
MGLRPSSQLPVPEGGLHGHRHNGVFVRGTRNGVLTAVEDFVAEEAEAGSRIRCATVPGYHALAILAGESSVAPGGRLAQLLDDPAAALARWGVARALACSEVAARRTTLDALQRATLTPAHTGEGLQDLPTPFASGHVLRDLLHWTLLSQRFHAQLLRAVDEILTEAAVPYALADGTLLGALRHGGPIPHDDDMDLVVPAGDMDRMRAAVEAAGLAAVETGGWPQLGRTFVIHVRHPHVERCGYWPKSPALDVFPVTEGPHAMVRTGEMLPLVRRLFCDFTANVPARAEAVLARRFGPEWATECHVWQHGALP